ncbi:GNAT family N-acetyltransferase [Martelella endophytica]|uniref:N-acetyltransferase domain-containing protein n=1 Tax=Martelella endophytica TaxID=1486262 RepID=A0A0D5LWQ9_MAREN|nr:GNAT family N-acetyltransferase [Martelella endophytica]AJY48350.1 hypothetical protein TM49_18790 [Martelella endophytica]
MSETGYQAWLTSSIADPVFTAPEIRARAKSAFAQFPEILKGDIQMAFVDGVPAGWGARSEGPDTISDLWIAPVAQGRGVGSALIEHFLAKMAEERVSTAFIETWTLNEGAIRLYRRHGFVIVWQRETQSRDLGIPFHRTRLSRAVS